MALATTDDLAMLLGREFTDAEESQAEMALRMASASVTAELPDVALEAGTEVAVTLPGTWSRWLRLPKRQVTEVHSVAINGTTLDPTEWAWPGGDSIRRGGYYPDAENTSGAFDVVGGAAPGPSYDWGGPHAAVEVVYSYTGTVPPAVWAVTVQVAKRLFLNPAGVRQESLGGYAVTYDAGDGVVGLNSAELAALRKYRTRAR